MADDKPSPVSIPFLPLPPNFNALDMHHWNALSKQIELCLVTEVDISTPKWGWGCNTFWLAFIATCPLFPSRGWSPWDPRISVDVQFITGWLNDNLDLGSCNSCEDSLGCSDSEASLMFFIWGMFCKHVALFYPLPLLQ
ncbi:hypothetical protein PAXRUDRAFT_162813 [Paxillus rubicundulus Ve08.2h10]|uniref:Uncharacterized protein n=1 Tax=Paxillus rubicundulus Ve08.2h10 TaxID=930991 RepID=A0A0D0DKW7_9AGAM|nr:hypothetical protein PAXRUDRAFT_162813 [Paxillus rubicundulus Ve08.2h10]